MRAHCAEPGRHLARRSFVACVPRVIAALLFAVTLSPAPALACGNHTHIGISLHAVEHLPEGPLKALASDPALNRMLLGGTIFPDGGYAIGHGYGEAAHWEPLQRALHKHLLAGCTERPLTDACRQKLAFALGMASHGMADQVFDGLFMEAAKVHDKAGWSHDTFTSLDTMSDVLWAARHGAAPEIERWLPMPELLAAFSDQGITVEATTIEDAQFLLITGVLGYVRNAAKDPKKVADAEQRYPWSAKHLGDPHSHGGPFCVGRLVAAYWQHLWDEWIDGGAPRLEVLGTLPSDGGGGLSTDKDAPEAIVGVVFSRGLDDGSKDPNKVSVTTASGATLAVKLHIFYGQDAHMLRLIPKQDWPTGERVDVHIEVGAVTSFDGLPMAQPLRFAFTPGPRLDAEPGQPPPGWSLTPAPPTDDPGPSDEPDGGCTASRARAPTGLWLALLVALTLLIWRRSVTAVRRRDPGL